MGSLGTEPVKGVDQDDLVMPVIDFSRFVHGTREQQLETAQQISDAFQHSGFLYLSNHEVSEDMIKNAYAYSAKFFARPQSQKDELAWTTPQANRGYVIPGREKVTDSTDPEQIAQMRANAPDLKETIEIGREGEEGHPNQWPDKFDEEGKEFTSFMKEFFLALQALNVKVMSAIAVGMLGGLDAAKFFDSYTDKADNTLRLLHYPAVKKSVFKTNPHQVRAGAHSDYGSITLLLQDAVGGLEVQSPRGTWVRAKPIPGTIVVNAGDLLMRWSNDTIKSTRHRVIQPPPKPEEMVDADDENAMFPARYSIAYFCNPNFDSYIDALPGVIKTGATSRGKLYEGINSGQYLAQRLGETF